MNKRVVLAYSGGLDTDICIRWLQQQGFKVFALLTHLGQSNYLEPLGKKAVGLGATSAHIADLRHNFINSFIFPALKANACYEKGYFLGPALSRPIIVQELVRMAAEENCNFVAHGSGGVENDLSRFEKLLQSLAPELKIIAPLKELNLRTIEEIMHYAQVNDISIDKIKHVKYNIEENIWGINIQVYPEADLWKEPPFDTYLITTPLEETPDKPTVLEIGFEKGVPVLLDSERTNIVKLIETLNKIGGRNAIGRVEMVENKISGEKIREIYEAPAATILYTAHQALEEIILDKQTSHFKETLSRKYAELVYEGTWFIPFRQALDRFFDDINEKILGLVKLKVFKGNL